MTCDYCDAEESEDILFQECPKCDGKFCSTCIDDHECEGQGEDNE